MAEILKLVSGAVGGAGALPEPSAQIPELAKASESRARAIVAMIDDVDPGRPDTLNALGRDAHNDLVQAVPKLTDSVATILGDDPEPKLEGMRAGLAGLDISDDASRTRRNAVEFLVRRVAPGAVLAARLTALRAEFATAGRALSEMHLGRDNAQLDLRDAYRAAVAAHEGVTLAIAAGRERMARDVGKLAEDHARTLEIAPENRPAASDAVLPPLRAARDRIEKRIHALRHVRNHTLEALRLIRGLSEGEAALNARLAEFLHNDLAGWDQRISEISGQSSTGGRLDTKGVDAACRTLAQALDPLIAATQGLGEGRADTTAALAALDRALTGA